MTIKITGLRRKLLRKDFHHQVPKLCDGFLMIQMEILNAKFPSSWCPLAKASPQTLVAANDKRYARIEVLQTLCERLETALAGGSKPE